MGCLNANVGTQALNNAENHLLAITSDNDEYEATTVSIGGSSNETGSKTMIPGRTHGATTTAG